MRFLAENSMLAMVSAAVIYLFAVIAHAAEWASARHAVSTVERRRRRILVGPADLAEEAADASAPATAAAPGARAESDDDRLRTDRWSRIGIAMTLVGFACHVLGVVGRGLAAGRLPWGNMYEFTTSALVFVVALHLVLATRFGMRWLGLPVSMAASIGLGLAVTVFYVEVGPLVPALHSVWFLFHILAATVACAAFTIGGIASILYLVKQRAEADGTVHGYLAKAPSSEAMDRIAYRTLAFAFPLFTFVIAAGAIWAQYAWGRYWGWDPKETWSLITWAVYAAYLHARATAGWKGRRAAVIAIVGMVVFWWNFVGVNLFVQGLHSYAK